jgi:hypothetical protein
MPRLRKSGDISPLPLYVFMAWIWKTLPLLGSIYQMIKWPRVQGNNFDVSDELRKAYGCASIPPYYFLIMHRDNQYFKFEEWFKCSADKYLNKGCVYRMVLF